MPQTFDVPTLEAFFIKVARVSANRKLTMHEVEKQLQTEFAKGYAVALMDTNTITMTQWVQLHNFLHEMELKKKQPGEE
jgi:ribulose bisphosphate carboxylase small subunit